MALSLLTARADAYVYWDQGGKIGRASHQDAGGSTPNFVSGFTSLAGIAVDGAHIYWSDQNANRIGRANLDGTGVEQNFIPGANKPYQVAVDAGHVYWANSGTTGAHANTIGRADLNGNNPNQDFISGANVPVGVAVNGSHIYWSNFGDNTIGQATIGGSIITQSLIGGANGPSGPGGLAIDADHLYWTNQTSAEIGRSTLDGNGVDETFIDTADSSHPIAVAVDANHVYWTNSFSTPTGIGRANLDGTGADQGFITGTGNPFGVAVDGLGSSGGPGPPGGGPGPTGGGGSSDPACQDPTRILVRCVNPTGAFTIPGVCGPSFGTILPACNIPNYPPTVCGPSFGTILTACQLPQSKIIACGGFGTILPQCNHPPPSVPQVCGGTGTLLPKCTGANQLALACGPSTGTPLAPCNFPTKINATVLEPNKAETVTLTLSCPPSGARTTAAGRGARAAKNDPDTCDMTVALKSMRVTLWETLAAHAYDVAQNFVRLANVKNDFIDLQPRMTPDEKTLQKAANLREAEADRKAFGARVSQLLSLYFGASNRPKDVISRDQLYELLTKRSGSPPYLNPEGGVAIGEPIDVWALAFDNAVRRYRQLEDLATGKKTTAASRTAALVRTAQIQRPKGGRVLSKHYKIRTGRKRGSKGRGKLQRIKIRLSKRTVNALIGEARKSKGSKRVIPLRLLISYSGKLQGRSIPVARLIDVQLRVKSKAKPKHKTHARSSG